LLISLVLNLVFESGDLGFTGGLFQLPLELLQLGLAQLHIAFQLAAFLFVGGELGLQVFHLFLLRLHRFLFGGEDLRQFSEADLELMGLGVELFEAGER